MPINWIAAVKLIPWADVVQATPTVVRGAKDLWSRTKKSTARAQDASAPLVADSLPHLSARVGQLESEQLEATALITALAEQNAQLVAALDNLRSKIRILQALGVLLTLGGVVLFLR